MVPEHESGSHSALASFGEDLRREREIRGISLKEIADATKVSRRFLEALENNEHRTLPAPVFTRGFVREYARYLGLSAEDMVSRYNVAAASDDRIEKSQHLDSLVHPMPANESQLPLRKRERRDIPPALFRIDGTFFALVVLAAALAGVSWWAIRHKEKLRLEDRSAAVAVPRRQQKTPPPQPVVASVATSTTSTQPAAGSGLQLTADFTSDAWVALDVDGQPVLNDEVKRGERRTWSAGSEFRFRTIGNAGGIELTLNGVRLPDLGPEGKVLRDLVINRETLTRPETVAPEDDRSTP